MNSMCCSNKYGRKCAKETKRIGIVHMLKSCMNRSDCQRNHTKNPGTDMMMTL